MPAHDQFVLKFDYETTKIAIFFDNERAAVNSRYTLKKSGIKNINLAIYKSRIIGMEFNSTKVTKYSTIAKFLTEKLAMSSDETQFIMDQIVGLSGHSPCALSNTIH